VISEVIYTKILALKASPLCLFANRISLIIHFKKIKINGEKMAYVFDYFE